MHHLSPKPTTSPIAISSRRSKKLTPDWPIVSEEGEKPDVTGVEYFWLVDPLDGTKSFVRGEGYFTVNIGLIHLGRPVLGVIYDPAGETLYAGCEEGAFRKDGAADIQPIRASGKKPARSALISHSHINRATEDYLNTQGITERIPCASSIKFCWLAEGRADIYPRFGPTMEWDNRRRACYFIRSGRADDHPRRHALFVWQIRVFEWKFRSGGIIRHSYNVLWTQTLAWGKIRYSYS